MAEGLDFLIPSLLFMKGALIDNQRSSNKFAASGNRSALRLPGSFRRRAFHADLLMPQGALLRRGRSDSFTPAKPEEDDVGNQCRIRQKGGIITWRYFILQ